MLAGARNWDRLSKNDLWRSFLSNGASPRDIQETRKALETYASTNTAGLDARKGGKKWTKAVGLPLSPAPATQPHSAGRKQADKLLSCNLLLPFIKDEEWPRDRSCKPWKGTRAGDSILPDPLPSVWTRTSLTVPCLPHHCTRGTGPLMGGDVLRDTSTQSLKRTRFRWWYLAFWSWLSDAYLDEVLNWVDVIMEEPSWDLWGGWTRFHLGGRWPWGLKRGLWWIRFAPRDPRTLSCLWLGYVTWQKELFRCY